MKCEIYKILYKTIPLNILRAYLIKKHFSLCGSCSAELADEKKIKEIMKSPHNTKGMDLWAGVKKEILSLPGKSSLKTRRIPVIAWKWRLGLTGAALLIIIILLPFLLHRGSGIDPESTGITSKKIVVKSLRIENRPAKSFYFQSKDRDKIIVWVQKTKS